MDRRQFLTASAAAGLAALPRDQTFAQGIGAARWNAGDVKHLLPTVDHQNILIKVSFARALRDAPLLVVDGKRYLGQRTDTEGMFWSFHSSALAPARRYTCSLRQSHNQLTRSLCSSPITSLCRYYGSIRPSAPHR